MHVYEQPKAINKLNFFFINSDFYFIGRVAGSSIINEQNDHYSGINSNGVNLNADETDNVANFDDLTTSSTANTATAVKRHSLRSTSSFCDEVFLEELANLGLLTTSPSSLSATAAGVAAGGGYEDDTVSYGALSLGALSNGVGSHHNLGAATASSSTSVMALNSIVEFDEGKFN